MATLTRFVRGWWAAWLEAIGGANRRTMRRAYEAAYDNGKTVPHAEKPDAE